MTGNLFKKSNVSLLSVTISLLIVSFSNLLAVDNFDVLPSSGRTELFHTYLMNRLDSMVVEREANEAEILTSVDKITEAQSQLRENYRMLLGEMPIKTPLNTQIVGTIDGDGYKIEKLHYESVPNHHVTANFYIPTTGTAPYPTIIVTCGHYPSAKAINLYQNLCRLLATNGFAALIVDPISQAERAQVVNPINDLLYFKGQSGTSEHSYMDVGAVLSGTSVTAYELWDNVRGIDYLYSRTDVVDTTRVGNTGSSGGGSQATYLIGYDRRIKVSAINSFLMNEQALFKTIGPQTASQNLSYEGAYGIDHTSYIAMFAPKPLMILAATQDFFDVMATRATYDASKKLYSALGAPEKVDYFEYDDTHGYSKPKREEAVKWFRTWFYADTASVVEPDEWTALPDASVQVTSTGQVMTEFATEVSVTDISAALAEGYQGVRSAFWNSNSKDSCLNMVRSLLRMESYTVPLAEVTEVIDRDYYDISKIKITSGVDVPVTGLLFKKKDAVGKLPVVLYVDGRGKKFDAKAGRVIEYAYVDSSKIVFAIDVRGFGETADNTGKNESKHGNREHRNSVISLYIGKTLIGQRVSDIQKALDILLQRDDVDPTDVKLIGIERAHSAVLHAAALDTRITEVEIRMENFKSWIEVVNTPLEKNNMTHQVPNALLYYDIPNLIGSIAPRSVVYATAPLKPTGVGESTIIKSSIAGYPNPFKDKTELQYVTSEAGDVSIAIYNEVGLLVSQIDMGFQLQGAFSEGFDATGLKSGVYLFQLNSNNKKVAATKLMVNH